MKSKVFGMASSYKGLTQCDWLWKQTPQPFGTWKNIQMLSQAHTPDFMLFYQYDFAMQKRSKQTLGQRFRQKIQRLSSGQVQHSSVNKPIDNLSHILRGVSKECAIYLMREPPLEEMVSSHKIKYQKAQEVCGYVSGPEDFAPVPDYMPAIWYVNVPFQQLAEAPPPLKVKTCSWISSGISRTACHRKRLSFMKQVQESALPVDIYGRNLPDWANSLGSVENKWHVISPYTYNLAIENYADNDWYVSEKLWDALLAWCLPIYYGGGAADKLLPEGSFIRLPSLDEKGIQFIQDVISTSDVWQERKEAIAEARQIILHKLNLLNWLSEYVDRFESLL